MAKQTPSRRRNPVKHFLPIFNKPKIEEDRTKYKRKIKHKKKQESG